MMVDESDDIQDLINYNNINSENLDAVLGSRFLKDLGKITHLKTRIK